MMKWSWNGLLCVFSPIVQFQLLHSKFHLCCLATRQLMLSTYVKFVNLFPEIKAQIQQVNLPTDTAGKPSRVDSRVTLLL